MPIRILPQEVASQIAAGEVVERPASVVKELVENSLDAGATYVRIAVEGAGQRLVEVADDGCGIPAEELPLAVARHATSKLQSAEDLFHIHTLGFRGEALTAIGSVACMTITSRPRDAESGARLTVDGGQVGTVQPVGAPAGTVVRVEDLFYNLPARRKFLKKPATERRRIDALVTRYALAYSHVRFHLEQEGRLSLQTSGNGDRREALAALYGVDIARQMLEVHADDRDLKLSGFISPINLTRSNRRGITFFVNGRWVQDAALTTALTQAYHQLLMVGRFPLAVIFLDLPPETVDVNIHPTKAEVRFRDKDRVFRGVQRAIRRALLAYSPLPGMEQGSRWGWVTQPSTGSRSVDLSWDFAAEEPNGLSAGLPSQTGQPTSADSPTQVPLPGERVPLLRLLGQVGTAYLVAEGPDGLYLIDQHAAHERVLFEKLLAQLDGQHASQNLLQPINVELSPEEAGLVTEQLEVLARIGFRVELFGRNAFLVRAIPALLGDIDPAEALRVLVVDFEEDETPLQAEVEARVIARVCKRAAVKAGQVLSPEEQRQLLRDLESCQAPRTCPHGRPTMIHLSVDLLERQFGRRGAR